jgi:hypothetical protein
MLIDQIDVVTLIHASILDVFTLDVFILDAFIF